MPDSARLRLVHPPVEGDPTEPLSLDDAFRRYAPYVAKIGLRILGRSDEVDDLVQDVFLAAHRGIARLRSPEAVRGWLATVAVRCARRRLRLRAWKSLLGLEAAPGYEELADPSASPEDRAIIARVYRLLEGLPADERIAWVLHRVEEEPLPRVALLVGRSLATVKRRIARAARAIEEGLSDG